MDIDEVFNDKESQESVKLMVKDYEEVFERIRPYAKSTLCAWFATQAWMDWQRSQWALFQRKRAIVAPASDIQLCLLNSLGVGSLADLSREEAQIIIDGILQQDGKKVDGQLPLTSQ